MANQREDAVAYPEVFTLHWEGPPEVVKPPEHTFPQSPEDRARVWRAQVETDLAELRRNREGRALWEQIEREAAARGDRDLWRRKLAAYHFVKLSAAGSAGEYARRFGLNHATVRSWIADVAKLAYQVGYRLHEDRLLLVGQAPEGLKPLRELVNRDAGSREAWDELRAVANEFRGEDPYFHLNEGHVLRARGALRESDATLREGLTLAEARPVRGLLWNARGQTFWDCDPHSRFPLPDYLSRAERAFRRAAVLDASTYFPFVNLAQLAFDAGDLRRGEYWIGELAGARKAMDEGMKDDLARYLNDAEWTRAVDQTSFWNKGPKRWLREAARRGVLVLAALALAASLAWHPPQAGAAEWSPVSHKPIKTKHGGAGGN